MNSELECVYLRTFCNFATAVNGLLWDLLMWFEDMSHALLRRTERGLGYFQEDYMGWKRSRVGTDYDAYCYLFFWPKIKERKAPVAQSGGKQASKHKSICAAALDDFISLSWYRQATLLGRFSFPFLTAIMKYRIFNHLFKLQIDKVNKSSLSALDLPRKSQSNDFGTIRNSIYGWWWHINTPRSPLLTAL